MSKKDFKGGLDSLLGETSSSDKLTEKPKNPVRGDTKTSKEGTKDNETRATFIVNEEHLDKLKSIAYWDRILIKDVVAAAFEEYLNKYEKKNGAIKAAPAK